jgi:hypothetical protein
MSIAPTKIERNIGDSAIEYTDIALSNGTFWSAPPKICRGAALLALSQDECGVATRLCLDLLVDNWQQVVFGPCIEGAVFELQQRSQPVRVSMLDGYLTLYFDDVGEAHFHLCTDVHRGLGHEGVDADVAHTRQCGRAAFFREFSAGQCTPGSWGIRLWNGEGEQMCTFFLPNPYLNDKQEHQSPDWSRLSLWNSLRARYLGEQVPQPIPEDAAIQGRVREKEDVAELGGPSGPEPTRYGDWERKGKAVDF